MDLPSSKSIAQSLPYAVAFLSIGLPLAGVTYNLYLGAAVLVGASIILLHAFWNSKLASQWSEARRVSLLWVMGLVCLSLVGFQIRSQYLRDHPHQLVASNAAPASAKTQPALASAPTPVPPQPVRHKQKSKPQPKDRPAPPIEQSGSANGLVGGNFTQGPGSIAQLGGSNNTAIIGTQDWLLTREQQLAIQAAVAKYPGRVRFSYLAMDPSSLRYAEALGYAFNAAGWEIVDPVPNYAGSRCFPNSVWDCMGASVAVPNRLDDSGKTIISTLSAVVPHLKVLDADPDMLDIFVSKP
jgi:hypothetical protein